MSLVEVLISLSVTAALLAAVGAAFSASASAIDDNDEFNRTVQIARVAMAQLLTEIRRSDGLEATAARLQVIRPAAQRVANEWYRTIEYSADTRKVEMFLTYLDGTASPRYVLAREVTTSPFASDAGTDANGQPCVARVTVTLDVRFGKSSLRLSGSAAPRRVVAF